MTSSKTTTKTSRSATKKTSAKKPTAKKATTKKTGTRKASAGKTTTRKTAANKKNPAGAKRAASLPTRPVGDDQIALRAYEIWQQQGQPMGLDTEHWYQAERELRG